MTLFAYLNGADVGHRVRLNAFGLTCNADGSVGFGGIVFDDAAADLTVRGWMTIEVRETACTSAPVLFSGFVGPRTYGRSGEAEFRVGNDRWIDTTLVDENAVLHIRLITGANGKRPAETHNARIDWLLASAYMSGLIDDTSLVDTSNPRPFEEADYRGQYADDVLSDISAPIFRIFFVYTLPTGGRGLFFDTPTATTGTSSLRISNVLSDVDSTVTFAPSLDTTLNRDPSEVYSRVRYVYKNGVVIEDDAGTLSEFFTDNDLGNRGLNIDNSRVGLESTARAMAQTILSRDDSENDTISVTLLLPAAQVGLIRAGQRISVRFSHLPGYESFTWIRVTSINIQQAPETDVLYAVTLELNSHGPSGGGGGGAPGPGTFPHPPSSGAAHYYEGSFIYEAGENPGSPSGFGIASLDEPASDPFDNWQQVSSTNTAGAEFTASTTYNYEFSAVTQNPLDLGGSFALSLTADSFPDVTIATTVLSGSGSFTTPSDLVTDTYHASHSIVSDGLGTIFTPPFGEHQITVTFWIDPVGWDPGEDQPPMPGQPVGPETVTMDGADGETLWPFADGSLRVFVDNVDQTAAITSYDGAAGTFTLAFSPRASETVVVWYQGR